MSRETNMTLEERIKEVEKLKEFINREVVEMATYFNEGETK
tara:strand:- start:858 stop:980 length:123 start_codon:yes stop_codon:yes gene_type:complete